MAKQTKTPSRRALALANTMAKKQPETRRVSLLRDSALEYPELWLDVFIAGDRYEQAAFAEMFVRAKCSKALSPDKADLVVFTGGSDVNPALYGEERHPLTLFDSSRDEEDMALYGECYNHGIPMFGVCRGAQFLHVMNGGKLFQDVDHHNGDHLIFDVQRSTTIPKVSSVHHQMVRDNKEGGMEVIATAAKSRNRWLNDKDVDLGSIKDIEAFFYRDTCSFGVQGHPEYKGYSIFMKWCLSKLQELVNENIDLDLKQTVPGSNYKFRRIKDDILPMRTIKELA